MGRDKAVGTALAALIVTAALGGGAQAAALDPDAGSPDGVAETRSLAFESEALGRTMPYLVYLPPGYERSDRRYPVLYLLHGMSGSRDEWRAYGLIDVADKMVRSREIAPLVIVMPQGDRGYWMDHADAGREAWGTYVVRDVVREIDGRFRTRPERSQRAIGGVSMGAHGALQLALNNPAMFTAVGAHSLVLRRYDQAFPFFGDRSDYARRDPATLVDARPDVARSLALWLDIGDRDPWVDRTVELHDKLDRLGVDHEWHRWRGDHSASYWRANAAEYVRFYDAALRKTWRSPRANAGPTIMP